MSFPVSKLVSSLKKMEMFLDLIMEKFSPVSVGQHIFYGDEIIVEVGGSAQVVDYKDRTISLSGSTSLSLFSEKNCFEKRI